MASQLTKADVEAALADFKDPESGRNILVMEQVSNIDLNDDRLSLTLALTTHSAPLRDDTRDDLADDRRLARARPSRHADDNGFHDGFRSIRASCVRQDYHRTEGSDGRCE